jgi:hypothetical protein
LVNKTATEGVANFGTIGNLIRPGKGKDAALKRLCATVNATDLQQRQILATYKFLAARIRNRDAHAYMPNVREAHFDLVSELFTGTFNLLCSWLPSAQKR